MRTCVASSARVARRQASTAPPSRTRATIAATSSAGTFELSREAMRAKRSCAAGCRSAAIGAAAATMPRHAERTSCTLL